MARILTLNSDEHQLTQELMPWFVNGTLDPAEAAQVREHMAQCSVCQLDALAQTQLRGMPVDAKPSGNVDRDWAALRGKLDFPPDPRRRPPPARSWWRQGFQIAVAVQAAVVLVLAVALVRVSAPTEPYRALGSPLTTEANALAVFHAEATNAEMSAALRAAGARIVGGPTTTDAYLVRLSDPGPDALARLRKQPGVRRVESLQGEPAQ